MSGGTVSIAIAQVVKRKLEKLRFEQLKRTDNISSPRDWPGIPELRAGLCRKKTPGSNSLAQWASGRFNVRL